MGLLRNMFANFRQNGIKIAVDDFGTGFASLDFLRAVPVDVVKIDREYVKNIKTDNTDKSSVQFISDLAGAFSADVCAEGIENDEIRLCVREYNKIGSLQGYFYSKPVTADEIIKKLD
jgi:EAL domain-containing protein (putative c-di-GMP-specific phosphodiesterase class I)